MLFRFNQRFLFINFENPKSIRRFLSENLLKRPETFFKSGNDFLKMINKSNPNTWASIRNTSITEIVTLTKIVTLFWPHKNVTIMSVHLSAFKEQRMHGVLFLLSNVSGSKAKMFANFKPLGFGGNLIFCSVDHCKIWISYLKWFKFSIIIVWD